MEIDLTDILKVNIQSIQFFGYFSPEYKSKFTRAIYEIYASLFISFWFFAFIVSETVNMILVFGNMEKMTAASFLFLTHLIQVIKLYYFKRYNQRIHAMIRSLNRKEFQPKNKKQQKILTETMQTSQRITKFFMVMVVATCVLWGVFPLLDGNTTQLPLSGWFPFSTENSPVFEIVFLYQTLGAMLNGIVNISVDTFISGNIMMISAQFEILNDTLVNLREFQEEGEEEEALRKGLIGCVEHHRNILEFADEVTFLFTSCIMGQFVIGVVIICITMFQMTLVSVLTLQFWSMALYQSCILLEEFLHCYYGNEVILQSNELTKSAYVSAWADRPTKFKRELIFFMTRSQRPLKLYAGGFFTLSLETFVTILRTSWSYFAVLNHVHATD